MIPKVIWKFALPLRGECTILLPEGLSQPKPLYVAGQRDEPCVWVLVNQGSPRIEYGFRVFMTGEDIPSDSGEYVGTCLLDEGAYVCHVFFLGEV